MKLNIELKELIQAYRSVKLDCWYEKTPHTKLAFAKFEENLIKNLKSLLERINEVDLKYFSSDRFLGTYYYSIKKIELKPFKSDDETMYFFGTDLSKQMRNKNASIKYRIMSEHSVEFHILSALWIIKVGSKIDAKLSPDSYGCRLKLKDIEQQENERNSLLGDINSAPTPLFQNYLPNYKRWQHSGLQEMSNHIKKGKRAIAITLDLTKYYHRISPIFINNQEFLDVIDLPRWTSEEKGLNDILIQSLRSWSVSSYKQNDVLSEFKYNGSIGVPISIGASKIIANALLCELDKKIEQELNPVYYGRYVDDIFIVLNDNDKIHTSVDFWAYLRTRIKEISPSRRSLDIAKSKKEYHPTGMIFHSGFSPESLIEFGPGKEKYFFLDGGEGVSFLKRIKDSINENSSEWKLPPDIEEDSEKFNDDLLNTISNTGETIISLSKVDEMSVLRQKFVLYLKRFKKAIELFPQSYWDNAVKEYLTTTIGLILRPENIAVYQKYYAGIFGLAISSKNYDIAKRFFHEIKSLQEALVINDDSKSQQKRLNLIVVKNAIKSILRELKESLYFHASPFTPIQERKDLYSMGQSLGVGEEPLLEAIRCLFEHDLHTEPLKSFFTRERKVQRWMKVLNLKLYEDEYSLVGIPIELCELSIFKKLVVEDGSAKLLPNFFFYTRRFSLSELSFLNKNWHFDLKRFLKVLAFFRIKQKLPDCTDIGDNLKGIFFQKTNKTKLNIALTSLLSSAEDWKSNIMEVSYDNSEKIENILRLVRSIIKSKQQVDYVIFPELSIPRSIILYLSEKLLRVKISLIAGLEYRHRKIKMTKYGILRKVVQNEIVYFLLSDKDTYMEHLTLIQQKYEPAIHEEKDLYNFGSKTLYCDNNAKYLIHHNNAFFSSLICNEFLDIELRSQLRGNIDLLFVLEWNQDKRTYDAIVNSSANDLHCFIAQVNNRQYGDTRLRAPYSKEYKRDCVQIKGGEYDYFVVGSVEFKKLRKFQNMHRGIEGEFKPLPTGYKLNEKRKI